MKTIRNFILALVVVASVGGVLLTTAIPQTAMAASDKCNSGFLGFPAWYRGLTDENCNIKSPSDSGGISNFIWHIVLNIIEMAMLLVGYISAFFFLYGGFQFITSQGDVAGATKARTTLTNAAVGLIISLVAVVVINFVVGRIFIFQ